MTQYTEKEAEMEALKGRMETELTDNFNVAVPEFKISYFIMESYFGMQIWCKDAEHTAFINQFLEKLMLPGTPLFISSVNRRTGLIVVKHSDDR